MSKIWIFILLLIIAAVASELGDELDELQIRLDRIEDKLHMN